jgi:D-amino peptidase
MKLYIHTDLEGAAGIVHFEDREDQTTEGYFKRLRMEKLLTGEVNAAVEGALEMGVREILVNDSHGSGYNILFEELNPAAQIIHGPLTRQPFWTPCLDATVDFVFCIAQHAMAGTRGLLVHSLWYVNDLYFGEAGMCMAIAGSYGVPTLLVTGDATATSQVKALVPQIETVAVKEALSPYNAKSWTPRRACEMIKAAAKRAIARRREIPPFAIKPPYKIGFPPRPGEPPKKIWEGQDFVKLVREILCNTYDYELQDLPVWPMEPGWRTPALPKVLRKRQEAEGGKK